MSVDAFYQFLRWFAVILFLYVGVSVVAYAFRHPEKTQTQIVLDIKKALEWK